MKIKCSDAVKCAFSSILISECIMMSNLIHPTKHTHIFKFCSTEKNLTIKHQIPSTNTEYMIKHKNIFNINATDTLVVVKTKECLFLFLESEFLTYLG